MTPSRTLLITGASGFLGGYAGAAFAAEGWSVVGADRNLPEERPHPARPVWVAFERLDVSHRDRLREVVQRHAPDLVLHLAAAASVELSAEDPAGDFESQCVPLVRVLETLRRSRSGARFLLVSSAAVYGEPESLPISESASTRPLSPYGFHKLAQEAIVREFAALGGLRGCIARVFSTYGPGLRRLAVWEITRRALRGDFALRGSGTETRDYLHAADVARALVRLAETSPFDGEVVNVASGEAAALSEVAALVYAALGHPGRRPECENRGRAADPSHWRAEVGVLRSRGFLPSVALADGIAETVRWIAADA